MWSPFWRSLKMNGPDPAVGLALNGSVVRAAELASACLDRMPCVIELSRNGQDGAFNVILSVRASGASTAVTRSKLLLNGLAFFGSRIKSKVNLASSAVSGWPSDHLRFGRMWKV